VGQLLPLRGGEPVKEALLVGEVVGLRLVADAHTSDLTRVQMSSYQALPPPYGSAQGVLTSSAALAGFRKAVASDHIGLTTPATSNSGCTGGVQYTVVLEMSGGKPTTTLNAYNCGGQITGNITGDVPGFLAYVSTLLVAVPSEHGYP
jgi:hypothetical protein